jgi:hypothetical protein
LYKRYHSGFLNIKKKRQKISGKKFANPDFEIFSKAKTARAAASSSRTSHDAGAACVCYE